MNHFIVDVMILCAVSIIAFEAIKTGLTNQEVVDCNAWKQQSVEYAPQFYLAAWQKEQCDAHGITINAPVK